MTPATEAKAAAINIALRRNSKHTVDSLALLLALLTSANKDEREGAKREVRDIVRIGSNLLTAERAAENLAHFANRHEP